MALFVPLALTAHHPFPVLILLSHSCRTRGAATRVKTKGLATAKAQLLCSSAWCKRAKRGLERPPLGSRCPELAYPPPNARSRTDSQSLSESGVGM